MKLREARLAQEKYREEAALQEVHMMVEQMAQLKESLTAAVLIFPCLFCILKYESNNEILRFSFRV